MRRSRAEPLQGVALEPVSSRQTVQDTVYQRLAHALMTGRFNPGQALTIASLSELFGTSHMPVREALRRLAAENAVEIVSTGSACVPQVSQARLDDLFEARVLVEGAAAEKAAPRASPALIRALERSIVDQLAAGRESGVHAMLEQNQAFHFALYQAAGSDVLVQLIGALWLRFGPYLRLLTQHMEPLVRTGDADGGADAFTRHHRAVVAALKAGDAAQVRASLVADIVDTQTLLRALLPPELAGITGR